MASSAVFLNPARAPQGLEARIQLILGDDSTVVHTKPAKHLLLSGGLTLHNASDIGQTAAEEIVRGARHLIAVGGDGLIPPLIQTIMEYAIGNTDAESPGSGLADKLAEFVIGILPLGTGNDLAHSALALDSLDQGLQALANYYQNRHHDRTHIDRTHVRSLDVMAVSGYSGENKVFTLYTPQFAGFSYDVQIVRWINQHPRLKRALGSQIYTAGFIGCYQGYQRPDFTIAVTGEDTTFPHTYHAKNNVLLLVTSISHAAGGLKIAEADPGDGRLGVFTANNMPTVPLRLLMLAKMGKSILWHSDVDYREGSSITLTPDKPLTAFQIAGDLYTSAGGASGINRVTCSVPGQIPFIVYSG
ncbi:hypothetical protein COY95_01545 [Candidatus Woesearchaeota archaeon CG_4_10_14_0_8_um_filter_47_5]|nr:MAG: hypothetical protein COY95_01545 [Candidatus Woesearchaeota archaeon CG_4_10_14_0_8_um_filter_47_5]